MRTKVFSLLLREYRTRRWGRFTAWVCAYGAALWVADRITRASGGVPGLLWLLFWVCALVSGIYYLVRLMRFIRRRVLWRLQRRLVVAYVLIGVVPICLIVLLVVLGAFIINGQFAAYLVVQRLRDHFDEIEQVNRVVLHEARYGGEKSAPALLPGFRNSTSPNWQITRQLSRAGDHLAPGRRDALVPAEWPTDAQSWPGAELDPRRGIRGHRCRSRSVTLRSMERIQTSAGDLTLLLSQPFTPELLDLVGEGIGPVGVVETRWADERAAADAESRDLRRGNARPGADAPGTYVQTTPVNSSSVKLPGACKPLRFSGLWRVVIGPHLLGRRQAAEV